MSAAIDCAISWPSVSIPRLDSERFGNKGAQARYADKGPPAQHRARLFLVLALGTGTRCETREDALEESKPGSARNDVKIYVGVRLHRGDGAPVVSNGRGSPSGGAWKVAY